MKIVIIYHSGYGHTKIVAEHIKKGALREVEEVKLLSTLEAQDDFDNKIFGPANIALLQ